MFKNILVATDGSDHGTKAVRAAASLAVKFDASLKVSHVLLHGEPPSAFIRMADVEHLVKEPSVPKPDTKNIPAGLIGQITSAEQARVSREVMDALGGRIVDHAVRIAEDIGVKNVSSQIADGDTANRILKIAEKINADLIVIGTRGFGPLKALLMGSTSLKVTQLANCAVLTVK
jgi:nucleotide-binding universal stress UspA family protein